MTRSITQVEFDRFAQHMLMRFKARLIRKDMAVEMQLLAAGFDVLRSLGVQLPVGGDFLNHYATTLGPLIYMPSHWSLDTQLEVLVHELQHVHQFWGGQTQVGLGGGLEMAWLYLTEPEARVRYEAEAYRAQLEIRWARERTLPTLDSLALPLEGGYALGAETVALGRQLLEIGATTTASSGRAHTVAGLEAVTWLRINARDLLAQP